MNQGVNSASHLHKGNYDQSLELKLQNNDEFFHERVENDFVARDSDIRLGTQVRLNEVGFSCQSMKNIDSLARGQKGKGRGRGRAKDRKIQENLSMNQVQSVKSYKSATKQQILSKYEITSIIKRKHEEEENKCRTCKTVGKITLIILFFPFYLIWLLVSCIITKCQKKSKPATKSGRIQQKKSPTCCKRCFSSIQICCTNCFCYYLCCQCCDCHCCTRCCRNIQKCCQCLCENSCMESMESFFHCCLVRNCEKCCRCICCHRRQHQRVDTIQRLERMSGRGTQSKIGQGEG